MIPRYSRPEMAAIFAPENRLGIWLDVELAAAEAMAEIGAVPGDAVKTLATAIAANHLERDAQGRVAAPEAPGLGIAVAPAALRPYLQQVEISVGGRRLYETPPL